MKNMMNTVYLFVLGIVAVYTKELVTFIMLGVILIALNNINGTLKEILEVQKRNSRE
ncbi:hypothetical protein [Bacillus sp. T3]|uniref:hypothetical protein n=1 Tax=Bacillus sp. T3 TaxID=467262 RepID=UPI002981AA22|nr:hypothetical protein [Bacillus sp. T3]